MWSPVEELVAGNQQSLTGGGTPSLRKVSRAEHYECARLENEIASVRPEVAERDRIIEQLQSKVEALKGGDGFQSVARRFQAELDAGTLAVEDETAHRIEAEVADRRAELERAAAQGDCSMHGGHCPCS
jgi:chromosome segregation ATPase